jgi:hypothetical protein
MRARWMMAGLLTLLIFAASPAHAVEARSETLWIFDADFEDLLGDNAGWVSEDFSGTLGVENFWHKDTIRINGFEWLGDSTWWCGTYNACWLQPRGYGNDWYQVMWRDFPLSEWSEAGDDITLEWDQRFAMEKDYDYGYVEVSSDEGLTWDVLRSYTNPGFAGKPGMSQDWDSTSFGHPVLDLSGYAGSDVELRFRFESDEAYSAQDEYDNIPLHSVLDGAWQLDNIEWKVNDATVWLDDCESPGDNGWQHPDVPAVGQTGVAFRRSLETVMGDPRWMMVAYDEGSGVMVSDQQSRLFSPAVDISGASDLVLEWSGWIDMPQCANDIAQLATDIGQLPECFTFDTGPFGDPWPTYYGGPLAFLLTEDYAMHAAYDWFKMRVWAMNHAPEDSLGCHGAGFMLDRFRVGVPLETHVPDEPVFATRLLAPSPNPFNPTTTIAYTLETPGRVTIRIYDVSGRVVRTLVDEESEAGEHAVVWDGTTDGNNPAASGVYFIRMESGGRKASSKEVQRLVLLK